MDKADMLPPRPGSAEAVKQIQPPMDAIPFYFSGGVYPLTIEAALGCISQLSGALSSYVHGKGNVFYNEGR